MEGSKQIAFVWYYIIYKSLSLQFAKGTLQTTAGTKHHARMGECSADWQIKYMKDQNFRYSVWEMAQVKMTQIRFLVGKLCELVEAINRNKNICFFLVSLNRLTLKCLVLTVKLLEMLVLVVMIFSRSLVNHVYTCVLVRKGRVRTWSHSDVCICKVLAGEKTSPVGKIYK